MALQNKPNGLENNDQQQVPEVKALKGMNEIGTKLDSLRDEAATGQEKSKDALKARIQKTVDGMLNQITDPKAKQEEAVKIVEKLKEMEVDATITSKGEIQVNEVGLTAEAMVDVNKQVVSPETIKELESVDISPASRADIRKALLTMDTAEVTEMASQAQALIADIGPEGVQMMIDFSKAADQSLMTEQFKDSAVGLKVQSLIDANPVYEKFFKNMEGGLNLSAPEGDLAVIGDQVSDMFSGKGFESLMKMIGEVMLFINDLKAQLSNGELPRLTDKGIDQDIDNGRHLEKHKKNALSQWKATRARLEEIGTDDSKGKIGELRTELQDLHNESNPEKNDKRMNEITDTIKDMKEQRTELVERKAKLESRLARLGLDPEKDLQEAEEKEKNEITKGVVDGVNSMPMNDIAVASDEGNKGVLIKPKSGSFDPKIADKLKSIDGAVVDVAAGDGSIYIENPTAGNTAEVLAVIRSASSENIDSASSLAPHEKKGLKGAMESQGDWFGPIAVGDISYQYIQLPDGEVYAQSTVDGDTWKYEPGSKDFMRVQLQYLNGETGALERTPSLKTHKYNAEKHVYEKLDEAQLANRKLEIKTAGEAVLRNTNITQVNGIYELDATGSTEYYFQFNEGEGEWQWQFGNDSSWHSTDQIPVDLQNGDPNIKGGQVGYPASYWAGLRDTGLNEAKQFIKDLEAANNKDFE